MSRVFEIRSKTVGEVDTFYHWLQDNRPELLDIPGLVAQYSEAGIMGMPGQTVKKFLYRGPEKVPAEVVWKLAELRDAVERIGGTLEIVEDPKGFWERLSHLFDRKAN